MKAKDYHSNQFSEQIVLFDYPGAATEPSVSQKKMREVNDYVEREPDSTMSFVSMKATLSQHITVINSLIQGKSSDIYNESPYNPLKHLRYWCENAASGDISWCENSNSDIVGSVKFMYWWFEHYYSARVGCLQMVMKMHPLVDDIIVQVSFLCSTNCMVLKNLFGLDFEARFPSTCISSLEHKAVTCSGEIILRERSCV